MRFAPIASVLALAAAANAQVSASMMQSNIDQITELSSETNDIAKTISITNIFSTAPVCSMTTILRRSAEGLIDVLFY